MNANVHLIDFLPSVPVFAEFDMEELSILDRAMAVDNYPDGYRFLGEDKRSEHLYLLIEGQVVATHRRLQLPGEDVFERLGPGDIFGLIALLDHRPAWATYRARGEVVVASLPVSAFELLVTANAPIAHHFHHLVAMQLVRDLRHCVHALKTAYYTDGQSDG